jgi:putative hydrolase of the HAD superfamily
MEYPPLDVDVVLFDAVGTLFEVDGSVGAIYSRIAARHGVVTEPAEIEAKFRAAFHAKSLEGMDAGPTSGVAAEKAWWLDLVRRVFSGRMRPEVLSGYFEDVFEAFRSARAWVIDAEARPTLDELRARGYRLGVVSNYDSRLFDVLANLGIDSCFDRVVVSWHAGSAKPDPEIFYRALAATGVSTSRALHVGDSLREDVAGAAAAGLHAALLDRQRRHAGWSAGCRLETLRELLQILPGQTSRTRR